MSILSKYQTFLKAHFTQNKDTITHTRIGDRDSKIYGGAYSILDSELDEFYSLYTKAVIDGNYKEYLTEKQLPEYGPIVIDLDFRYPVEITTRQHSKEHIQDFIYEYFNILKEFVDCTNDTISIYIMEKPQVNRLDTVTKDGIHIIIDLYIPRSIQLLIREKIINDVFPTVWSDIQDNLINDWSGVFDEGIVKGGTNWQLFGSRKVNHERYWITNYCIITYNTNDNDFDLEEQKIETLHIKKNVKRFSVRTRTKNIYPVKNNMQNLVNVTQPKKKFIKKPEIGTWYQLNTKEKLEIYINQIFDFIKDDQNTKWGIQNYFFIEAHDYTMTLPESYYGPGSYDKWIAVGWALRNENYELFPIFLKFSAQSTDFDWSNTNTTASDGTMNLITLIDMWKNFTPAIGGKTLRSLMYWSKQENPSAYNAIKDTSIGAYIDETLKHNLEFDIANVVYHVYKDHYICSSIKNNIWYEYKHGRWYEIDQGTTLRQSLSTKIYKLYRNKSNEIHDQLTTIDPTTDSEQFELLKQRSGRADTCASSLKKTQIKNNIMREARDLFYERKFEELMDSNNHILCFNNGVIDFEKKEFREGVPEDFNSKSTNIDYQPLDRKKHAEIIKEIEEFMYQLFPIDDLRRYMFDHLASCLIGKNENQTFNIYNGVGRNGKSALVTLMYKILGDYTGSVPITLITQKRGLIGGTSSEVVNLRGCRYAVMQESSKGDQINEGIMKELTGGDKITARGLYKDAVTFVPQFKLVMMTNNLFDIKSNDDGTWRRIRICEFLSLFTENPEEGDKEKPYQFKVDKKIDKKFDIWAPVFMGMLVERAFVTQGIVEDCDMVLASSAQYRADQDYLAEYVKDQIVENPMKSILVSDLKKQFKTWYENHHDKKTMPKLKEIENYISKRFGKPKGSPKEWEGIGYNICDFESIPE
tara:strand:+ start:8911 stop:11679 length:2769 start_codon:yes stop_codon:yes gene_type:complete